MMCCMHSKQGTVSQRHKGRRHDRTVKTKNVKPDAWRGRGGAREPQPAKPHPPSTLKINIEKEGREETKLSAYPAKGYAVEVERQVKLRVTCETSFL